MATGPSPHLRPSGPSGRPQPNSLTGMSSKLSEIFSSELDCLTKALTAAGIMCTISGVARETDILTDEGQRIAFSTMEYVINKRPVSLETYLEARSVAQRLSIVLEKKPHLSISWILFESRFAPMSPRIQIKYSITP